MVKKTKVVRDGNSWAVRLPKGIMEITGITGGQIVYIRAGRDKLIISKSIVNVDSFKRGHYDSKKVWLQAFEDAWFEIFGIDE
jgi:antitoxin component of MazEF toxin-antitoxin module